MNKPNTYRIDPEALKLLQTIEQTEDEFQRLRAIRELAEKRTADSARVLQDTFDRSVWRSTRIELVKALGTTQAERAVEFLCKVASNADDLGMASEAVLALGYTESPVAGELLASIILTPQHPLMREALIAIANLNWFPCDELIASVILSAKSGVPSPALQNAIIAAGQRRQVELLPKIQEILQTEVTSQSSAIFNTALVTLGRIGNEDTFRLLENLDTRFRAFAHQIKTSTMDNIRLRHNVTLEDVVVEICKANHPSRLRLAFQMLKGFSNAAAREAFELLAPEASLSLRCKMRIVTCSLATYVEDSKFILDNFKGLSATEFASLGRVLYRINKKVFMEFLAAEKSAKPLVQFLGSVYCDKSDSLLFEIIESQTRSAEIRNLALNALVAIHLMQIDSEDLVARTGKRLTAAIELEVDQSVKARMIRALGQIRYGGPEAISLYRGLLKVPGLLQTSAYAALALTDTHEAANVICKRIKQIISLDERADETARAVETLAKFSKLEEAEALANLPPKMTEDLKVPLLKILGMVHISKFYSLIEQSLDAGDFQLRILAIAASKRHMNQQITQKLLPFLDHRNLCLRGRALDSLTTAGDAVSQIAVLSWLKSHPDEIAAHGKFFGSFTPKQGESYELFLKDLGAMVSSRKGAMNQADINQAAVNLRDNLLVHMMAQSETAGHSNSRKSKPDLSAKAQHAIDESLKRDLSGFESYSETIKSVLRSGEVICQHPELFDARVDKSTVLLQFVKSIDLLLQERLGPEIFLQPGSDLIQRMQSRIVRLELDDETAYGSDLAVDLQISMYFSRDTFPAHKLGLMCRSVMSGQLLREQYKAIDGLRAWALLILLFGRNFKFRNVQMEAILPMAKASNDSISKIIRDLNELQEARNRAAHRGTMLEMGGMQEMRNICASVLNSLDEHLVKPNT